MTDLTKIEKPYALCTKEEQAGLDALVGIEGALQFLPICESNWATRLNAADLLKGRVYRQNPNWNPPKLDVPDWFWEKTTFNWAVMDSNGYFYLCDTEPRKDVSDWGMQFGAKKVRLDKVFNRMFNPHNFNPHNIPWDKSLTKRPEE